MVNPTWSGSVLHGALCTVAGLDKFWTMRISSGVMTLIINNEQITYDFNIR